VTIIDQHDVESRADRALLLKAFREWGILYRASDAVIVDRDRRPAQWMLYTWPVLMTGDGAQFAAAELLKLLGSFEATQIAGYGFAGICVDVVPQVSGVGTTVRVTSRRLCSSQ
jgi:hypothetical protein